MIRDGLCSTVLHCLYWQQDILLVPAWFDRFLNSGEDCPNIQRGFEVWWSRALWRGDGQQPETHRVRIVNESSDDSQTVNDSKIGIG